MSLYLAKAKLIKKAQQQDKPVTCIVLDGPDFKQTFYFQEFMTLGKKYIFLKVRVTVSCGKVKFVEIQPTIELQTSEKSYKGLMALARGQHPSPGNSPSPKFSH